MATPTRRAFLATTAALTGLPARLASARRQTDDLNAILRRASEYVRWYDEQLTALVIEERYVQMARPVSSGRYTRGELRRLVSEVAWVRLPAHGEAIAVREVLTVDDRATEQPRRLRRLLRYPAEQLESAVAELLRTNAAHNLGPGNINFPTFPLTYLRARNLARSRWEIRSQHADRVELAFSEEREPTIVKTAAGKSLPARGHFWLHVDGETAIERCELHIAGEEQPRVLKGVPEGAGGLRAPGSMDISHTLEVSFARDETLGFWVPIRMTDSYRHHGVSAAHFTGDAKYSTYRRFDTDAQLVNEPY